jgi:hypothetical protein
MISAEWESAQAIRFSVTPDLVSAAKQELHFLAVINTEPALLRKGPALEHAIQRYEKCWLPLLASQGSKDDTPAALVAPLDCAWVWHCHRLNPVQYVEDCERLYGKLLGAPYIEPSNVSAARKATEELWAKHYPEEEYSPNLPATTDALESSTNKEKAIQYDLVDAVIRQSTFYHSVSEPYVLEDAYLRTAEQRYKGFLHMFIKSRGKTMVVPTHDIDLMWHTHQQDAIAYKNDMLRLVGFVMPHNDQDSKSEEGHDLNLEYFQETKGVWETMFGMVYEKTATHDKDKSGDGEEVKKAGDCYPCRAAFAEKAKSGDGQEVKKAGDCYPCRAAFAEKAKSGDGQEGKKAGDCYPCRAAFAEKAKSGDGQEGKKAGDCYPCRVAFAEKAKSGGGQAGTKAAGCYPCNAAHAAVQQLVEEMAKKGAGCYHCKAAHAAAQQLICV